MTNKYNAKKSVYDGYKFHSIKEKNYYIFLKDRERKKEISDLKCQVKFEIIPPTDKFRKVCYIADFTYVENGKLKVIDVKGIRKGTVYQMFKIKQKLMYYVYNIIVIEI